MPKKNIIGIMLAFICVLNVTMTTAYGRQSSLDAKISSFSTKRVQKKEDIAKSQDANDEIQLFLSDPYAQAQWNMNNQGKYTSYRNNSAKIEKTTPDVDMDVYEAWALQRNMGTPTKEVVVAIIDTGVDYRHPDLAKNIWVNPGEIPGDGIDNDMNGYIDDIYGWDFYNDDNTIAHYQWDGVNHINVADPKDNDDHGTHIAGIIGAVKENGIGIAGVASNVNVKLMVLKINGGSKGNGSIANAIKAIEYATMMGADICNISWGTTKYSAELEKAIANSPMLFIAAAGNSGGNNDVKPVYPASLSLDNLISVTYVDSKGNLTDLSNYGAKSVDIVAPGEDILSTVVGKYDSMNGSSMAAPHVSAVAAMIYANFDNIYAADVKNIIIESLKPIPHLAGFVKYEGMVDAYRALALSFNQIKIDDIAPKLKAVTTYDKGRFRVSLKVTDEGSSGLHLVLWQSGKKTISDFGRGSKGTPITDSEIYFDKAGTYTFYASDYAGNETIVHHVIIEDTVPPTISQNIKIDAKKKTATITVKIQDALSDVRRVKYMEGKRKANEFLPAGAGTELNLSKGKASFKVKKNGIYSVFAMDHRGNITVRQIKVTGLKK